MTTTTTSTTTSTGLSTTINTDAMLKNAIKNMEHTEAKALNRPGQFPLNFKATAPGHVLRALYTPYFYHSCMLEQIDTKAGTITFSGAVRGRTISVTLKKDKGFVYPKQGDVIVRPNNKDEDAFIVSKKIFEALFRPATFF